MECRLLAESLQRMDSLATLLESEVATNIEMQWKMNKVFLCGQVLSSVSLLAIIVRTTSHTLLSNCVGIATVVSTIPTLL
jgi:sensor histidine kinase YesM